MPGGSWPIQREVVIDRPVEDVAAFIEDPSNLSRWMPQVQRVEVTKMTPQRTGSTFDIVLAVLGLELTFGVEVVSNEPARHAEFAYHVRGVDVGLRFELEPLDGSTRVRELVRIQATSMAARPAAAAAQRLAERLSREDLERLRAALEDG